MTEDYADCPEAVGKTVAGLKIYRDKGDGAELQIDFSDGTSFTCSFNSKPTFEAALFRAGPAEPEILKKLYDQ